MISYHYNICDIQLQLNTPREIWVEFVSQAFETAACTRNDVEIGLTTVPDVTPAGQLCSRHREKPVWRGGDKIFRGDHDLFREKMHICTEYSLNEPNRLTCYVREEDWLWATRSKYLWPGVMLNYILLHQRGLIFHASYIAHEGQGILFVAPSGTGKSTQAELWRIHRGADIINGDKAGVTLRETPMVHGVPFSGTSGICKNMSLPLQAVVVLSQAAENTVCRLGAAQAVSVLCPNVFVDQAVAEEWQLALNLLLDLVAQVPVYSLACTPDVRAVEALEQAMKEDE